MNDSLTKLIDRLKESGDILDRFQAEESRKRFEALPDPEPVDEFAPFDILPPEAQPQRSYTDMYRQRAVDAAIQRGASTEEIAAMGRGEWKPPEVGKPQEWLVSPVGTPNEVNENTPIPIDEFARVYYEQNNAPSVLTRNIAGLTEKEQGEYYREQPVWEARIKEAYNTQYGAGAYDAAIKRAIPRKAGELTGYGVGAGTIASKALEPSQGLGAVTPLDITFAAMDVAGAAGAVKAALPVIQKGAKAATPLARELATSEAGFAKIPGKAPTAPPEPLSGQGGMKSPVEPPKAPVGLMPDLQPTQQVIDNSFQPDLARKISNLPGAKQVNKILNPSAVAETPAEKSLILREVLRDEGKQKSQGAIAYLNELGTQQKVFGKLDDAGLIAEGKLKGLNLNDIRTYSNRYADKLTPAQQTWIKRASDLEKSKLNFLKRNGIDIKELQFDEGGEYAGRRVYARTDANGEVLDTAYVGRVAGKIGAKTSAEKVRVFNSAEEAIKEGYRYIPEDEALALNIQGAYNRVADKQMSDWLLTNIPWRTGAAPEALVLAAEAAKLKFDHSSQLLKLLNRAVRGERVPVSAELTSVYPEQVQKLKALIPDLQAGNPVADKVKALTAELKTMVLKDAKESQAALNARARANESLSRRRYDEASINSPAFSGKFLTGPEAQKTADTINKALRPMSTEGFNAAIGAINKVNSVSRFLVLAGDASLFGIQLIGVPFKNPKIFAQAGKAFIQALGSPEFYPKLLSRNRDVIARHPNLIISRSGATEFTEAIAQGGLLRKGPLKAAGKVLDPFQRGFEAAMDQTGIAMAKSLEHLAKTPKEIADLDQFINEFRGITSSARIGVSARQRAIETAVFMAPRYNRAIAGLLIDFFKGGIRGDQARKSLIGMTAGMTTMAVAVSWARGESPDEIVDHLNPQSSNFFTWDIAGQKIGPGSKMRSVLKLIGDSAEHPENLLMFSMDNPGLRFVRGNLSLATGTALDLILGKNFIGDPTRDGMLSFSKEVLARNLMPMWLQSVAFDGGDPQERLLRGIVEFTGGRSYPESEWNKVYALGDKYAQDDYGKKYADLNKGEKDDLERNHPDYKTLKDTATLNTALKGEDYDRWVLQENKRVTEERNSALHEAAVALQAGKITKQEFDKQYAYIRPYYSGAKDVLWRAKEIFDPKGASKIETILSNQKPEDKALDAYWEKYNLLLEKSELPLDWDYINGELDKFLDSKTPVIKQYILDHKDDWVKDLAEPEKSIVMQRLTGIEDESWWDDYRGASKPVTPSTTTKKRTLDDYLNGVNSGTTSRTKTIDDYLQAAGR